MTSDANYDKESIDSIYEFALNLSNKSLSNATTLPEQISNLQNKGNLGSLVERYFFLHTPPNTHAPDFPQAPLELKTTAVWPPSKKRKIGRVKERLVITSINPKDLIKENWQNSTFLTKCKVLLILFYKYDKSINPIDRVFEEKPLLCDFNYRNPDKPIKSPHLVIPEEDLKIIEADWREIQRIFTEAPDTISEGSTNYLGACRGGAGGDKEKAIQIEGFTDIYRRRFALKASYVSTLRERNLSKYPSLNLESSVSFDEAIKKRFDPFLLKTIEQIAADLNFREKRKAEKSYHWYLAKKMVDKSGKELIEHKKAGILLKTIRLDKKGTPKESMSFSAFSFDDIRNQEWEESDFYQSVESKFLFVIYRETESGEEILWKVNYWNMPQSDVLKSRDLWECTKYRIQEDARKLPKISDGFIGHVRPKAATGEPTELTPQGHKVVKKCFWLNASYIREVLVTLYPSDYKS